MSFETMRYSREQLAAVERRSQIQAQRMRNATTIGRNGRLTMQIPVEAYFNAIEVNGGVDSSGKTVWDDKGFVGDMARRHPEIKAPGPGRRVFGALAPP